MLKFNFLDFCQDFLFLFTREICIFARMGSVVGANMIPTCIFTVKSPSDTYRLQHV